VADRLGEILKSTLAAIESSKEDIFHVAETTRNEAARLTRELAQLRTEITDTIAQVDEQQKLERRARQRLMEVSRDYKLHTEKDMMEAYADAKDAQSKLQLLQSREAHLRSRRDELERSLRQMQTTIERAENMLASVGLAINLLQDGITEIAATPASELRQEIALRVIRAQEEERLRVAREIHDGPAQTLANIVLRLEIAGKLLEIDQSKVKQELQDLKHLVRTNLQDIRRIIFDLRPMALDDLGIVPALRKYLENFELNYGIEIEFKVEGRERRLAAAVEIALFRLIQEGMTNVAKHAHAKRVVISVQFQDECTAACIKDFGDGFDVEQAFANPGEHYGLIGMRERIEMFGGRMVVESKPGRGTSLEFSLPVAKEEGMASD